MRRSACEVPGGLRDSVPRASRCAEYIRSMGIHTKASEALAGKGSRIHGAGAICRAIRLSSVTAESFCAHYRVPAA